MSTTIASIEFKRYKALDDFSITLRETNILVGANNSGKSTVIGALRVLAEGLRIARSKSSEIVALGGYPMHCYRIPSESIAISTENVHTNYEAVDSTVTFSLSNENQLILVFPAKGGCFLVPEPHGGYVARSFRVAFPITIAVVPVLGPLEHDEIKVKLGTVQRNLHTTRASRNFRNYWYYFPERFGRFSELVSQTWPNMSITPPENDGDYLHMFCMEERMLRELFWAGFGFQVWCQLLTHLDRGREDSILVVDEPEIYLHPDLQRKLFTILSSLGPSIVMATHSAEIISAAVSEDVLLIDKKALSARRLSPGGTAQLALDAIGSSHKVLHEKNAKTQRLPLLPSQSISEDVVSIENKAERNSRLSPQEFITSTPDEVKPSHSSPRPNKLQAQRLPFVPIKGTERLRRDE